MWITANRTTSTGRGDVARRGWWGSLRLVWNATANLTFMAHLVGETRHGALLVRDRALVLYTPDQLHPNALPLGTYVIRAVLTDDTNGHRYRIRSDGEAFDRIAHEHELRLATA